ncbi:MAG: hypothetical protein ACOCQM_08105 [Natronomonas sp.]
MLPLHSGHPAGESAFILALAVVFVAAAFALTREGWTRVGGLVGSAALAGTAAITAEAFEITVHGSLHVLGHGLEIGALALLGLAGFYALFDADASTTFDDG